MRRREPLAGAVTVRAAEVPGPWRALKLQVRVENRTDLGSVPQRREDALPTALVAAHTIITVDGGKFLSMTDPPEWARPAVAGCRNEGGWPVLADPGGQVMLSSPIILYDHPELAEESPESSTTAPRSTRSSRCARWRCPTTRRPRPGPPTRGRPRCWTGSSRWIRRSWRGCTGRCGRRAGRRGPAAEPPALTEAGRLSPWWDPDADASVSRTPTA